jgi:hypothetical protein
MITGAQRAKLTRLAEHVSTAASPLPTKLG